MRDSRYHNTVAGLTHDAYGARGGCAVAALGKEQKQPNPSK
jgi:hypothetical protein